MFNLYSGIKLGFGSSFRYNPLINYKWDTTIVDGKRYFTDSGISPKYPALMASGSGVKFNGVDQSIPTTISGDVQTIYAFIDNTHSYDETTQTLSNYEINSELSADTRNNYIFYDGIFTATQKTYLESNPEKFLYREDNILKSQTLAQAEIDNVVCFMPLNETDDYVRDLANYSEGSELNSNTDFNTGIAPWSTTNGTVSWDSADGGILKVTGDGIRGTTHQSALLDVTSTYLLTFDVKGDATYTLGYYNGSAYVEFDTCSTSWETKSVVVESTSTILYISFRDLGSGTGYLDNISVKQLSGIYPITNYLSTCRTQAQNLEYGRQNALLKRDALGVEYASSFDAMECDGVSYVDTLYTPSGSFQIEEVTGVGGVYTHRVYKEDNTRFINGVASTSFTVPLTTITLNDTNIESIAIDEYRLFKVHTEPQDPLELYNSAVSKGVLS